MTPSILKACFIIVALMIFMIIHHYHFMVKLPLVLFNKAKLISKQKE